MRSKPSWRPLLMEINSAVEMAVGVPHWVVSWGFIVGGVSLLTSGLPAVSFDSRAHAVNTAATRRTITKVLTIAGERGFGMT